LAPFERRGHTHRDKPTRRDGTRRYRDRDKPTLLRFTHLLLQSSNRHLRQRRTTSWADCPGSRRVPRSQNSRSYHTQTRDYLQFRLGTTPRPGHTLGRIWIAQQRRCSLSHLVSFATREVKTMAGISTLHVPTCQIERGLRDEPTQAWHRYQEPLSQRRATRRHTRSTKKPARTIRMWKTTLSQPMM
jgi:hypothetical protein